MCTENTESRPEDKTRCVRGELNRVLLNAAALALLVIRRFLSKGNGKLYTDDNTRMTLCQVVCFAGTILLNIAGEI